MDAVTKGVDNYLQKINSLVACLKCDDWVVNADEKSVDTVFCSAIEIESTLSRNGTKKLSESLQALYPEYDFTHCGDMVLETFLTCPEWNEKVLLYLIMKYIHKYSKINFCNLLIKLLKKKKLRDESLCLMYRLKNESLSNMLKLKLVIYFWEDMIAENNENFENYLKEMFEKETTLFLQCLKLSSACTGHLVLTIILRHLNSQNDLKMWFVLLNNTNIEVTSYLCSQYPELMEGLLKFFNRYASELECQEGEPFSWAHNYFPLKEFIAIINSLLTNDGLVGVTVNEFINKEINSFDENFSFWLDVKTLL